MSTLRPEVLIFVTAAESVIKRATGTGEPLSEEEVEELARSLARLEEFLRLNDSLEEHL